MKRLNFYHLLIAFLPLLAISSLMSAQKRESIAGKAKTAEQEVRAVIANWARAVKNRDTDSLNRIYANDLFISDYSGGTRGKKEEIEILKPSATTRTMSVINENVVVRAFPKSNTAVVTAIVRMVFRTNGRDSPFAMRYTSFWEKRALRWQLTVLHTTRLPSR